MCRVVNRKRKVRSLRGLDEFPRDLEDLIIPLTVPPKYHCNLAVVEDMDEFLPLSCAKHLHFDMK